VWTPTKQSNRTFHEAVVNISSLHIGGGGKKGIFSSKNGRGKSPRGKQHAPRNRYSFVKGRAGTANSRNTGKGSERQKAAARDRQLGGELIFLLGE